MSFVTQRVVEDYERARRKAFWRQLAARLLRRGRANRLLAFEDTRRRLRAHAQHDGGLRQVPIDQIVGSVSRYHDFDRAFLPRHTSTRGRWQRIDRAYYEDTVLPPIELYQLGEVYFVKDGNHRVSVAREQGQAFIDAYVVRAQAPVPIATLEELEEWIRRQDAVDFAERTQLLRLRRQARVELTLPGQYEKLLEHIEVHRWYLGIERRQPVNWSDAVASWYDRVYLPLVESIRASGVLSDFPGRTEADLYLWIIEHHWYLRQSGEVDDRAPLDEVVRGYAAAFSQRPRRRLARLARRLIAA
jgi:hypothetical protein